MRDPKPFRPDGTAAADAAAGIPARAAIEAKTTRRRRLGATLALSLAACALVVGCGGGGSDASTTGDSGSGSGGAGGGGAGGGGTGATSPAIPVLSTTTATVTVTLPSGLALTPDKLTVFTALGNAVPSTAGATTLPVYVDAGSQLAVAVNAAGNPMLLGWIDADHATLSAATTADVLAYFALGGSRSLSGADAKALIDAIPTADGIGALEASVQSALAASADAFAAPNADVQAAIAGFAAPIYSATHDTRAQAGRVRSQGILIDPQEQSGVTVLQDPPFAAHLSNAYRRRAYAFVDRVSHTTDGTTVDDPLPVTQFEVPPVIGVNGGVTGAVTDIMNAYYGTQQTAYGPVTAPDSGSFPVALVDGSEKTTYRVTVVGPGRLSGAVGQLTDAQKAAQTDVALRGFVKDFMAPTIGNIIVGSGFLDFKDGQSPGKATFAATLLLSVTADFTNFVPTIPGLADKIKGGLWFDAATDITNTAAGSSTIRTIFINAFEKASADALAKGPVSTMLGHVDEVLNRAGGLLQLYDSSLYIKDLSYADQADQYAVVVNTSKITLNPSSSTIDVGGTVALTATALGVDDTSGYSFHWTTTTQVGDLTEIGGGARLHQTDYCSSSAQTLFTYESGAVENATDTVGVEVWSGSACDPARGQKLGSATATVTFKKNPYVLYGGPGGGYDCGATVPGGNIFNDDSLTVYLNGTQVFTTPYSGCGGVPPIALPGAKKGDTVRVVVGDEGGHHAGLSPLYLQRDGEYVQVEPGFSIATPDGQDNGVQYDHSFTLPF